MSDPKISDTLEPAIIEDGHVKCHNCGAQDGNIVYQERVIASRAYVEVRDGTLYISGDAEVEWDAGSTDDMLVCQVCWCAMALPVPMETIHWD
jgi:hypothetical protein